MCRVRVKIFGLGLVRALGLGLEHLHIGLVG